MNPITTLKVGALKAADLFTAATSPYAEFTRPALIKSVKNLRNREADCFSDLKRFWFFDELIVHRIPLQVPDPPPLDMGDQALWQGIYVAMLSMKYACIPDDPAMRMAVSAMIAKMLNGMAAHQHFHREGRPRLIRGYDRNLDRWEDDASNDTLTGHFAGLYFARLYGPPDLRGRVESLMSGIVQELTDNDLWLVKADGEPTTFGRLVNGVKTDPLQLTLALAVMTVGEHYSLNMSAPGLRHEIYSDHAGLIPYAKASLGTIADNWNDDHRAAIHLAILGMEDKSPAMRELVRKGVERHWHLFGRRANPWVNALLALALGNDLPDSLRYQMAKQNAIILSEYDLAEARYDNAVDRSEGEIVSVQGIHWTPTVAMIGGHLRATQPLPLWAMGAQDFPWQRHRYSVVDWKDHLVSTQRFNGAAYLCAYWASRLTGLIPANA